jgi:hypothetical protein
MPMSFHRWFRADDDVMKCTPDALGSPIQAGKRRELSLSQDPIELERWLRAFCPVWQASDRSSCGGTKPFVLGVSGRLVHLRLRCAPATAER